MFKGICALIAAGLFAALPLQAETIMVSVNGMVCAFCVQSIAKKVQEHPEVSAVNVDLDKKLVSIALKEGQSLSDEAVEKSINGAGYAVTAIERRN